MSEPPAGVTISEREGIERFVSLDVLTSHPSAVPEIGSIIPGRRGTAVPVRLLMSTDLPFVSVDAVGDGYRASIPAVELIGGGYLLVGTPDLPLTPEEGGPVRLMVVDGSTLCWNVKHVTALRATPTAEPDSVPARPPH